MKGKKISLFPLKQRKKKVLAIFAHPDDETISAGGFLLFCQKKKTTTSVCILSRGEKGKSLLKIPRQKLAALRLKELKAACRKLGVKKLISLDFPDMNFIDYQEQIVKKLRRVVADENPDLVVTHSPFSSGGHPDHIIASFCVFQVLKAMKGRERPQLYFSLSPMRFPLLSSASEKKQTYFVDISPFFQDKMDACLVYKTQIANEQKKYLYWANFFFDKELFYKVDFERKDLSEFLQKKVDNIRRLFLEIAELVVQIDGLDKKSEMILKRKYKSFLLSGKETKKSKEKKILRLWVTYNDVKSQIRKLDEGWYQIDLLKEFCFSSFNSAFKKIFANFLTLNGGLMFHASSLANKQKRGFVFVGKEGSGKSTILKMSPNALALADDASLLTLRANRWFVHGSPFYERNKTAHIKLKVPLKGIFFLHKAKINELKRLNMSEALKQLLPNIWLFRTTSSDQVIDILTFWWKPSYNLLKNINCFNLYFNKTAFILRLIKEVTQ